jgi:hypothetical protein
MATLSNHYNVTRLLLLGLAFHCLFILAVFDTYFTSPVVHGMASYQLESAEAKRLVLIVGTRYVQRTRFHDTHQKYR